MNLILASASPRRREILTTLGMEFAVAVPNADENSDIHDPVGLVRELALRKGACVRDMLRDGRLQMSADTSTDTLPAASTDASTGAHADATLIISSDTLVWCAGEILGKPRDRDDARRMLRLMSGREHTVFSGIALTLTGNATERDGDRVVSDVSATRVRFGEISERELDLYLERCHYMDKAGAYAIQEGASMFIDGIDGDFFTVMGLPVRCMYRLAARGLGIDLQTLCHKTN